MYNTFLKLVASITRRFHPRGTERLLRLICNPDNTVGFDTVIPYDKTLEININTSFFTEWFIFFKGFYEEPLIELVKEKFNGGTFVDVGANIGCVSLIAAKTANKIISIEPVPFIADRLQKNFDINRFTNTQVVRCVASDRGGTVPFYLAGNGMHSGMGSLYSSHARGEEIKVEMKTLDEIIGNEKVDFIKIDTEGHDRNVIMGAKETIRKNKPIIIFEDAPEDDGLSDISRKDVYDFLESLNYTIKRFDEINVICT